ncbi:hypothetical protein [Streptomyces erythrochromogenes]|uniref:hypothetical protein n=1 Tax=Streptomyces erythrochromogenes TaxID=285574 RepID=UPI00224F4800|nr:hypothetical protein [Streptomyces erythrochromogenes]MCX5587596.1 hypothetical protein [Streptomyces erythrochromogenes]
MTGSRIVGALFIDMGQQLKNLTWARPPRARYECLTCQYRSPEAVGAEAVARFVATIRADHYASRHTTTEGAQAA